MPSFSSLVADPAWLPHRLDLPGGRLQFMHIPRSRIAETSFLANLEPPSDADAAWVPLADLANFPMPMGEMHFVFHTAFCRSTVLARALDIPGVSLGLSEPRILNDLAAAFGSGDGNARQAAMALLGPCLALLSRAFGPGEAVFVKPSNHANALIPPIMQACPTARAVLLSHAVEKFMASIHRKGLPGRSWARRLYMEVQSYAPLDIGIKGVEAFAMTDLQVAGLAWLLNRRWFAMQQAGAARQRLYALDAEDFNARRAETLSAIVALAGKQLDPANAKSIADGPVFALHAKLGGDFASTVERETSRASSAIVDEEIEKVGQWIGQIAGQINLPDPPLSPLLR